MRFLRFRQWLIGRGRSVKVGGAYHLCCWDTAPTSVCVPWLAVPLNAFGYAARYRR